MLAISSMESYPVGKESLSSGQGPLTLRKKVLGARDRGATAAERHAQQERRMPLPKITEFAVTWPKQAGSGLLAAFLHLTPLVTPDRPRLSGAPRKERFWGARAMPLPLPPGIFWIDRMLRGN